MRVLITGGAGFIGSHLAAALAADGATVRVLDDLSTGREANLTGIPVELVVGDVADMAVVKTAVADCDLVFHQAALVSVPRSVQEPALNQRSNVTGTFNVFEAARQAGVKRVVHASSAAVYGNRPGLPKREDDPLDPITPYAAAKRSNELLARAYRAAYGMELVGLRYMNVFGPRQDPSSPYSGVLSIFCQAAIKGDTCTIFGDGEQTRDFVYVADVVQANLLAATVPAERLTPASVFNVGQGEQTSLNQIVALLQELAADGFTVEYGPERPGDIRHSVADIGRAREVLRFVPQTAVGEGMQATVDWFRSLND